MTANAIVANAALISTSLNVQNAILTAKVTIGTRPPQFLDISFPESLLYGIAANATPTRSTYTTDDIRTAITQTLASTTIH
jgi:hypothetical protein